MATLLIHGGTVLPFDADPRQVLRPGYVLVEGERIAAVEPGNPPEGLLNAADQRIDATGKLVAPGLINAHTHLFQCFLRGLADDRTLMRWLEEATWPGGLAMTEYDFHLAALLGFVENLRCGATSVLDQDYVQTSPRNMDAVAAAAAASRARVVLARGVGDCAPYFEPFIESAETIIAETGRLIRRWNDRDGGRVRVEFGPMIPWGCRPETLQAIDRYAAEWDTGVHIHVSETRDEVQMSLDATGLPPVRWLDQLGVLNERWQLVHCVWLEPDEMDIIAQRGSLIVHCPVSNMYLASGIAPVPEWLRRNIPVALATDGPGSNNSQDMLEVLKTTACLQKVGTLDATVLLPADVLRMAWHGGAQAMRLGNQIGRLAPGALADIITVNLARPHIAPVHAPASALVYNANGNDVSDVVVGGEVLIANGVLLHIDEARLVAECQAAADAMIARAGIRIAANAS
jgi:5-methylthioadenosine/S-adenosylhomocysteine deaminase